MKRILIAAAAVFSSYVVAILFQSDFWIDLLVPVCDLLSIGIIFTSIFTSANRQFRLYFILIGCSVLSCALGDILWAVYNLILHREPANSTLILLLYFGSNLFLLAATILYCVYRFRKWDVVQLTLDTVFFSIAILWFLWVTVFDKKAGTLGSLVKYSVCNAFYVAVLLCQIFFIGVWYMSVRKGSIPVYFHILAVSVCGYSVVNLIYFYLFAKGACKFNAFINVFSVASLLGIAFAVRLYYIRYPSAHDLQEVLNFNVKGWHKGLLIIFVPLLIAILKGPRLLDAVFFAILILLHEGLSGYIQTAISNKKLLDRELSMNSELERLVTERTCELESSNKELKQKNAELKYISDHDPLTGLYNRQFFMQRLDDEIQNIHPGEKLALVIWNINRFKTINDTYGHFTGDQILILLAGRVNSIQGNAGLLARLGGDEFAFAMKENLRESDCIKLAERIADVCSKPIHIGEYLFHITVSVGVALFPLCAPDSVTLFKNADIALHYAKETGSGGCISFYQDIDSAVKRKYRIGSFLETADLNSEFSLNFQPQFRMADRRLIGMEALLRWNCPELGPVSPAEFIPIAEEENLIIPIGNWVIEQAVSQISCWNRRYHTNLRMGINISLKQLDQTGTLAVMNSSIQRYHALPEWIDIEITEGLALDIEDKAARIKKYFGNEGISISIDDFGTGYSSLGYLNILSFDRLKIAKPLVDKITEDESSRKIVGSIIMLAKSLGIRTISEGVETREQYNLLLGLGCDQIQGFYLGKPLPPENFQNAFMTDGFLGRKSGFLNTTKAC